MATSRYDSSVKVKQEVIDRIKKMGMDSAVKAANSGSESAEFVEGAKRMYGNRVGHLNQANLAKRQQETKVSGRAAPSIDGGPTGGGGGGESKSVPMPKSAPAAASRRTGEKTTAEKALGKENARQVRKVTTPLSNISTNMAGTRATNLEGVGKALSGAGKKLGLNNPFKPRKRK